MSVENLTINERGIVTCDAYAHGGKAWLASVKMGGRFGLEREFGYKQDKTRTSNVYRELELVLRDITEGDCIEVACKDSSRRESRSYYKVSRGRLVPIEFKQIKQG